MLNSFWVVVVIVHINFVHKRVQKSVVETYGHMND